jgi:hypothetical protein
MPKRCNPHGGNSDTHPIGDEYLAERCEAYETARLACLAFARRRFPVGALVILPKSLGGWAGTVAEVQAGESITLKVERRVAGGSDVIRVEYVSVVDALRCNPRQDAERTAEQGGTS